MTWKRCILHAEAARQLDRLFPNREAPAPEGVEEEPSSDADDDYEEPEPTRGSAAARPRAHAHRTNTPSTNALLTWPLLLAFPLGGRPARPPKPPTGVWMSCTRGESLGILTSL